MTAGGPLLERDAEQAAFGLLLAAAGRGDGGAVVVEGDAGIGKSALLAAAAATAAEHGFAVRTARGGELEQGFAFGLARTLFAAEVRSGASLPPGAAAALGRAVHGGDGAVFAAHDGLYRLVDELAAAAPLLLCVDDAHWADAETVAWLVFLARRLDGVRAAVLVGRRPVVGDALAAEATVLRPALLSVEACAELARAAGVAADPGACLRATGGNPFLLGELLRELASGGDVESAGPDAVRRSVARRLAALPPACTDVAGAVAVLGADAEPSTIAALAGLPVAAVLDAVGELQRCALLAADLPPRFAHPLLRSAHYSGIPSGHRARAHTRAARVLAASPQRAAAHLLVTPALGDGWVVDTLVAAAAAALGAAAPDSAVQLLTRALAEDPTGARRADVLLALGHVERLRGRAEAQVHLRGAIELAADPVPAAIELGLAMGMAGRTAEGIELLERVLGELPDPHTDPALRLLTILLAAAVNAGVAHHRIAERAAVVFARVRGSGPAAAQLADALLGHRFRQADTPLAELAALAADARLDEPTGRDVPLGVWQVAYHSAADDLDTARDFVEHLLSAARRTGSLGSEAFLLGVRGLVHLRRGALAAAEEDGRAALDRAALAGTALPRLAALPYLVATLVQRGDLAGAEEVLDQHGLATASPPRTSHGAVLLSERATLRLAQNRLAEAGADARESLDRWRDRGSRGQPGGGRPVLAEIHRRGGDRDAARSVAAEELEIARELGLPSLTCVARAALGVIEGGDTGLAMLVDAAAGLEASPCRLRHAGVLLDLGSALRRARRPVEARDPLARALEIAHRCGAVPLAERAHTELLATGARPRRPARTGAGSLTAAERRVAWLAAQGRTNREIAQELFVTRRTVETHLGAVYRKLGIASRSEL